MGALPSHETSGQNAQQHTPGIPRRPLGPRPSNTRNISVSEAQPSVPETAIFGTSARDVRPIEYRPPVQQTEIVPNVVSLKKSSLTLVRSASDPFIYLLNFEFDASVSGAVTIYYCAKEVIVRRGGRTKTDAPVAKVSYDGRGPRPSKTRFAPGMAQTYRHKEGKGLDVRQFTSADMSYKKGDKYYPVVIRLEASYPADTPIPEHMRVRSQVTFVSLIVSEGVHEPQIIAQQVLVGGTIYRIQDLYGIGSGDVTASKETVQEDGFKVDTGHECVICLTESCNTAVLPCNHLCLCDDCGRILCTDMDYERRKCPVCRTQLGSLLRIIPSVTVGAEEQAEGGLVSGEDRKQEETVVLSEAVTDEQSADTENGTELRDLVSIRDNTAPHNPAFSQQTSPIVETPAADEQPPNDSVNNAHDSDNISSISTADSSQPAAGTIDRNSNDGATKNT